MRGSVAIQALATVEKAPLEVEHSLLVQPHQTVANTLFEASSAAKVCTKNCSLS